MINKAALKAFFDDRKRLVIFIFASIVIFFTAAVSTYFVLGAGEIFVDTGDSYLPADEKVEEDVEPVDLNEINDDDGIFNILLLGYGGAGHDGGFLTDSMLVAHVDTSKKKTLLISLPRDTWVPLPIRSDQKQNFKINHAYAIGANDTLYGLKEPQYKGESGPGNMAKYAVLQVTGLDIDYFAAVDFQGLVDIINLLDGIEVVVPVAFDDHFYPVKGLENETCGFSAEKIDQLHQKYSGFQLEKQFECRYEHLHFDKGVQHMDGETALKFVRSRHSSQHGGDFARSQRQQAVLFAIKDELISREILNDPLALFDRFSDSIRTDISPNEMLALFKEYGDPGEYEIKTARLTEENVFNATTAGGGQFILIPKRGTDDFSGVQEFVAKEIAKL